MNLRSLDSKDVKGFQKNQNATIFVLQEDQKCCLYSDVCFCVNDWHENDPRIHKRANCHYSDRRTALDVVYDLIKADMLEKRVE